MKAELLEATRCACAGARDLQAALVFGSALRSDTPGDLDLALLWHPAVTAGERWDRANRIAADLEHRIRSFGLSVDVKDLRELPITLKHRVLHEGDRTYVADRKALVRFQSETVPLALDFLPFHRRALEAAARRLARG